MVTVRDRAYDVSRGKEEAKDKADHSERRGVHRHPMRTDGGEGERVSMTVCAVGGVASTTNNQCFSISKKAKGEIGGTPRVVAMTRRGESVEEG